MIGLGANKMLIGAGAGASNGLLTGLVSAWEFDETSGTIAYDAHSTNNGTITGALVNQTGKINKAYSFDGAGDWVVAPYFSKALPLTISFWIKVSSSGINRITTNWHSSVYYGIELGFDYSQLLIHYFDGNGAGIENRKTYTKVNTITSGNWYNVVVVFNSFDNHTFYVNAVEYTLTYHSGTATTVSFSTGDFAIGKSQISLAYSPLGSMDQVLIYNRALSSTEVAYLYNSGNGLPYTNFTT